jgi:hypothetical protein
LCTLKKERKKERKKTKKNGEGVERGGGGDAKPLREILVRTAVKIY